MKKKVLFPAFLAALALPLCLHSNPISLNAEFIGEYDAKADYVAFAKEVNGQMADEGFVLLKNDGFLPMAGTESVSVVGKASIKLARGGAGSGSGSIDGSVGSESTLNLKASLTAAGFEQNPITDAFYLAVAVQMVTMDGKVIPKLPSVKLQLNQSLLKTV